MKLNVKCTQLEFGGELLPAWMVELPWGDKKMLSQSQFDEWLNKSVDLTVPPTAMSMAEKIALAEKKALREVVVIETFVEATEPPRYNEDDAIKKLGLQIPAGIPGVLVNNEAGPDGGMMGLQEAKELSDLFCNSRNRSTQISVVKKFLPTSLHHLMTIASVMDRNLRMQIALIQSENFGERGRGSMIPGGWAEFVDYQYKGEQVAVMEAAGIKIEQRDVTGDDNLEVPDWERSFGVDDLNSKWASIKK
jgi:hypothetical protein